MKQAYKCPLLCRKSWAEVVEEVYKLGLETIVRDYSHTGQYVQLLLLVELIRIYSHLDRL